MIKKICILLILFGISTQASASYWQCRSETKENKGYLYAGNASDKLNARTSSLILCYTNNEVGRCTFVEPACKKLGGSYDSEYDIIVQKVPYYHCEVQTGYGPFYFGNSYDSAQEALTNMLSACSIGEREDEYCKIGRNPCEIMNDGPFDEKSGRD